jgi:hypothetical protein
MLTFSHISGPSVRVSGGEMAIVSYPQKIVSGSINLLPSPQEFPSREIISWPGEYDVAGVTIRGIGQMEGQKVSYLTEVDGMRVAFLDSPLQAWDDIDIERLGDVHVLVLPAEDQKLCQKLIDDIDPRVLILVPGADGNINQEVIKAAGAVGKEQVDEYKLKGSLPAEGREVVVFGR